MELDKLDEEAPVYETIMQFLEWLNSEGLELGEWCGE